MTDHIRPRITADKCAELRDQFEVQRDLGISEHDRSEAEIILMLLDWYEAGK